MIRLVPTPIHDNCHHQEKNKHNIQKKITYINYVAFFLMTVLIPTYNGCHDHKKNEHNINIYIKKLHT